MEASRIDRRCVPDLLDDDDMSVPLSPPRRPFAASKITTPYEPAARKRFGEAISIGLTMTNPPFTSVVFLGVRSFTALSFLKTRPSRLSCGLRD